MNSKALQLAALLESAQCSESDLLNAAQELRNLHYNLRMCLDTLESLVNKATAVGVDSWCGDLARSTLEEVYEEEINI